MPVGLLRSYMIVVGSLECLASTAFVRYEGVFDLLAPDPVSANAVVLQVPLHAVVDHILYKHLHTWCR